LPEVPEGHASDWASGKSQGFIWVEFSTRNSEGKILNKDLAKKIRVFGKLRKGKFGESWISPKILT
jgi:hypothetical protein